MERIDESSPSPAQAGWLGAVDDDRGGRLSGWAITREGDPCEVVARVNGREFRAVSDGPRPDLAAKGQARGKGGWRIAVSGALVPGENRIEVELPDGTPLAGSPRVVTWGEASAPPARHLGAIDRANGAILSGWALTATGEPCEVAIRIGDGEPMTVVSDGTRADLAAKGMSSGGGGWHLFLGDRLAPGANRVAISFPDGTPLPGSPLSVEGPPIAELTSRHVDKSTPVPLQPTRPAVPSLAELDELSLDDLALAVASGRVRVEAPPAPEPVPPIEDASPAPVAVPDRRGWLARLTGRRTGMTVQEPTR